MLGASSGRGALNFVATWERPPGERNGFYFGTPHLWEYHWGLHFHALGFGFGFAPSRVSGPDFSVPPHIGFAIPLWFTSTFAVGLLLIGRHLRRSTANGQVPVQPSGSFTPVQHWLLTCSLSFAVAELFWLGAQYVKKLDALEIPLRAPLLPLVLLLDPRHARVNQAEWLPYAIAFWAALFCVSLVLSRRRTNPAIAGAVLLALACLFGVLVAFVTT